MTVPILVTRTPPGRALEMLADHGAVDLWAENRAMPRDELLGRVRDAAALYCMLTDGIDQELLAQAPALRVISQMAVGVDNIDVPACTARGIPVGHTPDVLTETTADTAFGLLIAAARRFVEGVDYVRAGHWRRWEPDLLLGQDVAGTVVGIVGFGRIGAAVARRASGFGMKIVYTSRAPKPEAVEFGASFLGLDELLGIADHVVVSVALTDKTRHLIGERELELMKRTATLVNVARGPIVDTTALVAALASGGIAAAGLDVTDPEPLPADHALMTLPNCIVIPHLGSSSRQTRNRMAELAAQNLVAGLGGAEMPACVNPEVYRV